MTKSLCARARAPCEKKVGAEPAKQQSSNLISSRSQRKALYKLSLHWRRSRDTGNQKCAFVIPNLRPSHRHRDDASGCLQPRQTGGVIESVHHPAEAEDLDEKNQLVL